MHTYHISHLARDEPDFGIIELAPVALQQTQEYKKSPPTVDTVSGPRNNSVLFLDLVGR
jgi:hypothetical protein